MKVSNLNKLVAGIFVLLIGFAAGAEPIDLLPEGTSTGGGGGDSATNTHGQRQLLDLIEKDELDYFIPSPALYNNVIPQEITRALNIMKVECKAKGNKPYNCPTQSTHPESIMKWTDYIFLSVFAHSYNMFLSYYGDNFYDTDLQNMRQIEKNYGLTQSVQPLKWAFVDFDLNELNDEGLVHIDNPETKKQLAIQKDGLVVINRSEFDRLDDVGKASLFVHESVLRAVLILNPTTLKEQGTENIRAFTRRFVKYCLTRTSSNAYPAYGVREAYDKLNIPKK